MSLQERLARRLATQIRNADFFFVPWHSTGCARQCMAREAFSSLSLLLILSCQQTERALSLELLLVSWVGEMERILNQGEKKRKGLKKHSEFVHEDKSTPIITNSGTDPTRDFIQQELQISHLIEAVWCMQSFVLEKWEGTAERSQRSPLGTSSFSQEMLGMWADTVYCCEGEGWLLRKKVQAFQTRSEQHQPLTEATFCKPAPCPTILNGSMRFPQADTWTWGTWRQYYQGPSLQRPFSLIWKIPGTGVCLTVARARAELVEQLQPLSIWSPAFSLENRWMPTSAKELCSLGSFPGTRQFLNSGLKPVSDV